MNIRNVRKRYNTKDGKYMLLEPVGDSPYLSQEERNSWDNWKISVMKLAEEFPGELYVNGQAGEKRIALSFDDAPDAVTTSRILDILKFYDAKASFSIIGVYLEQLPLLLERIYSEGHLILNHTYHHPDLMNLTCDEIKEELRSTEDKIFEIIHKRTALVRPPYGSLDRRVMDAFEEKGYKPIIWSLNTFDWVETEKNNIVENVVQNAEPGDIVLMHSYENKEPTVEALPVIISRLLDKGYKFVDLSEMLGLNPYKEN